MPRSHRFPFLVVERGRFMYWGIPEQRNAPVRKTFGRFHAAGAGR